MIIGLTGKNGSGKGTVADLLIKRGFEYYSLSDVIRHEIRSAGEDVTREKMIEMGRKLRREGGASVLAEKILNMLEPGVNYIVDSIRNPAEVRALQKRTDFLLINVEADQKVRFARCVARGRESDPTTLEEFIRLEEAELRNKDEAAQQLDATALLAQAVVHNEGSVEELERELDLVIKKVCP